MDRFCPNCGNNVADAKFCSKCGKEVEASSVSNSAMSSPNNTINRPPNAISNIPTKPKKKNGCAIGCLIVLILFGGFFIINVIQVTKLITSDTANIDSSLTEPTVKTSTQLIQDAIGITEEQAKAIEDILSQCEVTDIYEVTYKTDFDEDNIKYYKVEFKNNLNFTNTKVNLGILDNIVKEIYYIDYKLYGDGEILNKLSDFILSSAERSDLHYKCQKAIEAILVSPSTAKFASIVDWKFGKKIKTTLVQGYVDSQNGFGAMIRSEFQFEFEDGTLISLIFDGEEYIK